MLMNKVKIQKAPIPTITRLKLCWNGMLVDSNGQYYSFALDEDGNLILVKDFNDD